MEFRRITGNKGEFLPLLLLADESEDMILRYLGRGELFALYDPDLRAACVVTDEGDGVLELQNLAVIPEYQRRGYGRAMVNFLFARYRGGRGALILGTGDSPMTLSFYRSCGFYETGRDRGYFQRHYGRPVLEDGREIIDRVLFRKDFGAAP